MQFSIDYVNGKYVAIFNGLMCTAIVSDQRNQLIEMKYPPSLVPIKENDEMINYESTKYVNDPSELQSITDIIKKQTYLSVTGEHDKFGLTKVYEDLSCFEYLSGVDNRDEILDHHFDVKLNQSSRRIFRPTFKGWLLPFLQIFRFGSMEIIITNVHVDLSNKPIEKYLRFKSLYYRELRKTLDWLINESVPDHIYMGRINDEWWYFL